jgi:nicotinamidase-related amidase
MSREDSRLLIVDMQEKLLPFIATAPQVIANCCTLVKAARLLGPPVFATEQYPKGLGGTTPELAALLDARPDKFRFSCAEVLGWGDSSLNSQRQVVVAGIEAHVCVLQTTFDLLAAGFEVFVVADAVGSRSELDWRIALDRMAGGGAVITTTEPTPPSSNRPANSSRTAPHGPRRAEFALTDMCASRPNFVTRC